MLTSQAWAESQCWTPSIIMVLVPVWCWKERSSNSNLPRQSRVEQKRWHLCTTLEECRSSPMPLDFEALASYALAHQSLHRRYSADSAPYYAIDLPPIDLSSPSLIITHERYTRKPESYILWRRQPAQYTSPSDLCRVGQIKIGHF